jgi:hypothetical protein
MVGGPNGMRLDSRQAGDFLAQHIPELISLRRDLF